MRKVVYVAWASHCDTAPAHGWLVGYDGASLEVAGVFCTTPNATSSRTCLPDDFAAGGIWQSGGAPAIDAAGAIYFSTGNGVFDPLDAMGFPRSGDYGDSVLKLVADASTAAAPNVGGWGLKVADYFTPFDQNTMEERDADLGSGGVVLVNDQPVPGKQIVLAAGKEGTIYVLDSANMGKFHAGDNSQILQSLPAATHAVFGTPAVFQGRVYYLASRDMLKAFQIKSGMLSPWNPTQQNQVFQFPGATVSISSQGAAHGIVWALRTDSYSTVGGHVSLYAFGADDLKPLYNSDATPNQGLPGGAVKFAVPTVANGKVYFGTQSTLEVFGLLK